MFGYVLPDQKELKIRELEVHKIEILCGID